MGFDTFDAPDVRLITRLPLDDLVDALEAAGDAWREALNLEAEAENAYRHAHALAWIVADDVAPSARAKHCENQPSVVKARCEWNLAAAREKACHSKVEEVRNRLIAGMSHARFVREATGG